MSARRFVKPLPKSKDGHGDIAKEEGMADNGVGTSVGLEEGANLNQEQQEDDLFNNSDDLGGEGGGADDDLMAIFENEDDAGANTMGPLAELLKEIDIRDLLRECQEVEGLLRAKFASVTDVPNNG